MMSSMFVFCQMDTNSNPYASYINVIGTEEDIVDVDSDSDPDVQAAITASLLPQINEDR